MQIFPLRTAIVAGLALLLLFACSSAPKPQEEVVEAKNKAAEYAESGNSHFRQGLYDRAIDFFELSLAYNGSVDNQPGLVSSYNSLGRVYLAKGDPLTAESYFLMAYEIALDLDDAVLLAQSLNHQGELSMHKQQYEAAVETFLLALNSAERGAPDAVKAVIYSNIGTAYRKLGQPDTALGYFESAVSADTKEKNYEELATSYYKIAALHSEREDYIAALQYIDLALANDKKVENSIGIAKDYLAMGIIFRKAGNAEQAYASFQRALVVYRSIAILFPDASLEKDVRTVLENLVELSASLGREGDAKAYQAILSGDKE